MACWSRWIVSTLFAVTACSGGDGGTGSGTDGTGGSTGTTGTSTSTTDGTSGATTDATSPTTGATSSGTTGATSGSGATDSTTVGGSTGGSSTTGIDPDPLCMDFCAKKAECGIDGGQSLTECQALCLQGVESAANPDCELATLSQLACVAGLDCDEVLQWAGGDPVGPGDYPCKYTDVAIGEDCF